MDGRAWQATYSPWGHKELDTTEQLHFHFSQRVKRHLTLCSQTPEPISLTHVSQERRFCTWALRNMPTLAGIWNLDFTVIHPGCHGFGFCGMDGQIARDYAHITTSSPVPPNLRPRGWLPQFCEPSYFLQAPQKLSPISVSLKSGSLKTNSAGIF